MRSRRAARALALGLAACAALAAVARPSPGESLGRTDPNSGLYPDSSFLDFRSLLRAPAGARGFLRVGSTGHFVWPDGARARFWGVNVSNRSVFIDHERIDRVVETLARAGTNMVRFEALDSAGGLLDVPGSDSTRALNPDRLATLDYWIARLRARGIYYYLNLLDFRQFRADDDVPAAELLGRAAKPYAMFDARLIELQKEFAEQLLTHRNPLTGLRYVDDPALALVEICNEHGFFLKADALDSLVAPYGAALQQKWNRWLASRYGARGRLATAWGRMEDADVLGQAEDPAAHSVRLPLLSSPGAPEPNVVDVRRAPARLRDGVRFLHEVQRDYFRTMREHLRALGVRVPITGVVSADIVPDVASAAGLDFLSENYYADHPAFQGKDWTGSFFLNDTNPLRSATTYQIAPWLSGLRWDGRPVVVREWATVWPNRYRAISVPEMAAYASLQDWDAVLLFGYGTAGAHADSLSDFDHQADPTVWGLYALGALAFLRGDVAPAPWSVTISYRPEDLFRWPNGPSSLHRLAWLARVGSTLGSPTPSGRSLTARAGEPVAAVVARLRGAGAPIAAAALGSPALVSSTRQIVRRTDAGLLTITAPRLVAACGEFSTGRPLVVGGWTLTTATPTGALMVISLDGRPLSTSRHYVAKMVSRARNAGQEVTPAPPGSPARRVIKQWGRAPVDTLGEAGAPPTRLLRGAREILTLALRNGTWELEARGERATLVCDTSGARGTLLGRRVRTVAGAPITVDGAARPAAASPARRAQEEARRAVAK